MYEDQYTIVEDISAPGHETGSAHHLVDYETQELVSTLWSVYLAKCREGLGASNVMQAMRRVSYSLDSETFAGAELQRGIKVLSRSRRSVVFQADLWNREDGRYIHRAEMVTVFVEPGKGAVEIPEDFWANVEKLEGREIPVTERS